MDWTHRYIYKNGYLAGMEQQRLMMQEELDKLKRAYENASTHRLYYVDKCVRLIKELEGLREGTQGACYACEPVGELNRKLLEELKSLNTKL